MYEGDHRFPIQFPKQYFRDNLGTRAEPSLNVFTDLILNWPPGGVVVVTPEPGYSWAWCSQVREWPLLYEGDHRFPIQFPKQYFRDNLGTRAEPSLNVFTDLILNWPPGGVVVVTLEPGYSWAWCSQVREWPLMYEGDHRFPIQFPK